MLYPLSYGGVLPVLLGDGGNTTSSGGVAVNGIPGR